MWVNQIINVVVENKIKKTFFEKSLWTHDDLNIIIQFSAGYNWGALELTSDQYELIDEMSYDDNTYDSQYNAPSRFDIKNFEKRLFAHDRHFFGTDFCKVIQPQDSNVGLDEAPLKTMADLTWFKSAYNIDTKNVFSLFDAMSHNNWMFKGHSYSVDGDILVTKKSEYDYLWFEQTDVENKNKVTNCDYKARIKILDESERN